MGAGFAFFPTKSKDFVGSPFLFIDSGRPTFGLPASGRRTRGAAQKRRISKTRPMGAGFAFFPTESPILRGSLLISSVPRFACHYVCLNGAINRIAIIKA